MVTKQARNDIATVAANNTTPVVAEPAIVASELLMTR